MIDPQALRKHYTRFLRGDRVLLTGHSHQAWPDVAREGVLQAFDDAAEHVDDKWQRAFDVAKRVKKGIAERMGARGDDIALGQNSHELVTRFLSALDLRARPKIVTSSGEFHSLRRQLARLSEEGVDVVWVDAHPVTTLAERVASEIDSRTAAAMVSSVLFMNSAHVPELRAVTEACRKHGAQALFDAYHAYNVFPFSLKDFGGSDVFVTAGGYKYAQMGEGVCFLHVPPDCQLRPVHTGWFAEFGNLEKLSSGVAYGAGAERFAGSTYDPTSHYRAAAVLDFFDEQLLTVARLRELSLVQTSRIIDALPDADFATPREPAARAGFVAVRHPRAVEISAHLRRQGIYTDARGEYLRVGPAPYTTDEEIVRASGEIRRWR